MEAYCVSRDLFYYYCDIEWRASRGRIGGWPRAACVYTPSKPFQLKRSTYLFFPSIIQWRRFIYWMSNKYFLYWNLDEKSWFALFLFGQRETREKEILTLTFRDYSVNKLSRYIRLCFSMWCRNLFVFSYIREKIVTSYNEILSWKVDLHLFSLVSLVKKDPKSTLKPRFQCRNSYFLWREKLSCGLFSWMKRVKNPQAIQVFLVKISVQNRT